MIFTLADYLMEGHGQVIVLLFNIEVTLGGSCLFPRVLLCRIFGLGLDLSLNKVTHGVT